MNPQNGGQEFQYQQAPPVPGLANSPITSVESKTSIHNLQWKASEFIEHQKNMGWFVMLAVAATVVAGLVFIITRDVLSTVVVVIAATAFGVFGHQKPRTLTYSLLPTSLKIDSKEYAYDDFRSFSLMQDGALYSIFLQPTKRFMPPLSIYFAPQDGEKIFDTLAQHLPHEERSTDPIERLMRKIRF